MLIWGIFVNIWPCCLHTAKPNHWLVPFLPEDIEQRPQGLKALVVAVEYLKEEWELCYMLCMRHIGSVLFQLLFVPCPLVLPSTKICSDSTAKTTYRISLLCLYERPKGQAVQRIVTCVLLIRICYFYTTHQISSMFGLFELLMMYTCNIIVVLFTFFHYMPLP